MLKSERFATFVAEVETECLNIESKKRRRSNSVDEDEEPAIKIGAEIEE